MLAITGLLAAASAIVAYRNPYELHTSWSWSSFCWQTNRPGLVWLSSWAPLVCLIISATLWTIALVLHVFELYERRHVTITLGLPAMYDEMRSEVDDLDMAAFNGSDPCACRKLAKKCGQAVRFQLGCPKRSAANRILVTQRCDQWLRENCKGLRSNLHETALLRSVVVALTPSPIEKTAAEALFCADADDDEREVNVPHLVPAYGGWLGRFLAWWGVGLEPAVEGF